MPMEYEAKVKVEDLGRVEERLLSVGARIVDVVEEEDLYIDLAPCIDMFSRDIALRVRMYRSVTSNKRVCELTYKGPRISRDLKIRKEITLTIDDGYRALEIFRELGFERHVSIRKKRKIYRYGAAKIFLDDVEGLGKFVEIEVDGVDSIERFREIIMKILEILNLPRELISKSYLELILEKQ